MQHRMSEATKKTTAYGPQDVHHTRDVLDAIQLTKSVLCHSVVCFATVCTSKATPSRECRR
jgi:hypothetical protein